MFQECHGVLAVVDGVQIQFEKKIEVPHVPVFEKIGVEIYVVIYLVPTEAT